MRSDDKIIYAYENNKHIEGLEIRRLYELVDDPWNYLSPENVASMDQFIDLIDASVDFKSFTNIVDYGCGIGVFASRLKLKFPHLTIMGVDFDNAFKQSVRLFDENPFDLTVELNDELTEHSILKDTWEFPVKGKTLINFLNSSYYLFLSEPSSLAIEDKLQTLMTNLASEDLHTVVVSNSGFSYPRINSACKNLGMGSKAAQSLDIGNSNPKFATSLYIKIWNK